MMEHHDHDHDHAHPGDHPQADPEVALLEQAVRELLIEKGIIEPEALQANIEAMEGRSAEKGAEIVARAWLEPEFKAQLLADGAGTMRKLGVDLRGPELHVVENTPRVHNMVVCTLCSCYPRYLLGIPPLWYKSFEYRSRAVREPRAVLAEFGMTLGANVEVRVHDSTADLRYLVLPMRPEGTENMSQAELAALVSRDALIGTAPARRP
jgi:nitrile hydratase subunit alpha